MFETTKCHEFREARGDFEKYLKGYGIDIGCGNDPLRTPNGEVTMWDMQQGDAEVMAGIEGETYDFVYSSHCLEHLVTVPRALKSWIKILKPGGFLYVVVPDYGLYEKMTWPSMFNGEHKHTFSKWVTKAMTGRQNHWNIYNNIMPILESRGCTIYDCHFEHEGFDFNARPNIDQTLGGAVAQLCLIARKAAE